MNGEVKPLLYESRCIYEWEIRDFSKYLTMRPGENLKSPDFTTLGTADTIYDFYLSTWRLVLYPMGRSDDSQEYMAMYLSCKEESDVHVKCTLGLFDGKTNRILVRFGPRERTFSDDRFGKKKFYRRSSLFDGQNGFLINDTLKITCEIVHFTGNNNTASKTDKFIEIVDPLKLDVLNDLRQLLNNEQFSDVKFVLDEKIIYSHKVILSSRNHVFAAMFAYNMKENLSNEVQIEDITYDVFMELLRFIYCGEVNKIEEVAKDLYVAADKYAIEKLKLLCEDFLNENVCIDNAIDYLVFSDFHKIERLKKAVEQFMAANARDIVKRAELELVLNLQKDSVLRVIRTLVLQHESEVMEVDSD